MVNTVAPCGTATRPGSCSAARASWPHRAGYAVVLSALYLPLLLTHAAGADLAMAWHSVPLPRRTSHRHFWDVKQHGRLLHGHLFRGVALGAFSMASRVLVGNYIGGAFDSSSARSACSRGCGAIVAYALLGATWLIGIKTEGSLHDRMVSLARPVVSCWWPLAS